jgi:peptide/nickel transport system substrate-binding protein
VRRDRADEEALVKRRDFIKGAASGAIAALAAPRASAQARNDSLLVVAESGPNSLDFHTVGANRPVYEVVWNIYDRLITFGVKKDENGFDYYDVTKLEPELAEAWDLRDMSVTLKLRRDVKFADGTPLTAKDVKWSFDRTIGVGGYPKSAVAPASLVDPQQFVVVDDHTFRVDFVRRDKLTMPYLGVPLFGIYHSELVKKHATAEDPWGLEWTKFNPAGTGAYRVEKFTPGQELVYARNDGWKAGRMPKLRRVATRVVPSAGMRRALTQRGDADVYMDIPSKDAAEMAALKNLKIVGSVMENSVQHLSMNVTMKPFDSLKVRQAIAFALPYEAIVKVAVSGRARPLFGGPDRVTTPEWPQPHRYLTDVARAKRLLAEAGYPDGFATTLSFDLGAAAVNEPLCILVQEALGQIGIKARLDPLAGANWRVAFSKKTLPLESQMFGGWFNYADFFFDVVYKGTDPTIYNTMAYDSPEMNAAIDKAHYTTDPAAYDASMIRAIQLAFDDVPTIPLFQPFLNVAMQPNVDGYRYLFHRQLDYRHMMKV